MIRWTDQVIAVDGWTLPQPYTQDTVLVAPGQRVDVLVTASELGVWAFHCHVLSHAENEAGITFSATSRFSCGSRARYTSPIPPFPRGARM